jgi:diguanylate cyclase (GGDEF)-like protein/PAS domain S-box-containing protein
MHEPSNEVSERWWQSLVEHSAELIAVLGPDGSPAYATPAVRRLIGWEPGTTAPDLVALVHPDDRERVERSFARLRSDGQGNPLTSGLLRRPEHMRVLAVDGEWHDLELMGTRLFDDEGALTGIVVNGRDVTERMRAEAELRRRARQQEIVAVLGHRALMGLEVGVLMNDAVAMVADTLDVDLCSIFELDDEGRLLFLRAGVGWEDGIIGHASVSVYGNTQTGQALISGQAVIVEDLPNDPRFPGSTLVRSQGAVSGVTVAVQGVNRPFGALGAHSRRRRRFGSDDVHFLEAVANVLATAIERRQAEEDIRLQSVHDALTKLPNRTLFLDRLEQALARADRSHRTAAVLFLDLDRFKVVNDGLGHVVGDELLVEVAARLRTIVRPSDTVARFGGDEFVVLCDDADSEDDAVEVAGRILEALGQPFLLSGREVMVSASVGIAVANGNESGGAEALVRDADAAMYRAKERGKARFEIFDDAIRMRAVRRLETEQALRRALERGELEVMYQPGVWIATRHIAAVEALVRWRHPERGLVSPAEFIPVAEETGLIVPLGDFVLEQAAALSARLQWAAAPGMTMTMAVNLSARQLSDPALVDRIRTLLFAHGLPPRSLSLEITESVLMEDAETATRMLQDLKDLGVYLAVDDFGTGYSSLAYLKRFPVDALKVDKSFVDGLGREAEDSAIVRTIVALAQTLGLETVAEGVETPEQLDELAALGCTFAQGYYFAMPMQAAELEAALRRSVVLAPGPWHFTREPLPQTG